MSIKHYLSAAAALAMFAACSDYDPGMSNQAVDLTEAEIETIKEYTENFVERYGEMDPNHTWGFGELAEMEEMGTRAVQTETNMWVYSQDGQIRTKLGTYTTTDPYNNPLEYTTKDGWKIPGIPSDADGKYYTTEGIFDTKEALLNQLSLGQVHAKGDVTDEEIEYVSWWFRTHPNPTSTTPPYTEYFVQSISRDFDRTSYPSGSWKDYNGSEVTVPTIKHNADNTTSPDGSTTVSFGMDYFSVNTSEGGWEHNNNFNMSNANRISRTVPAATPADTSALCSSTTTFPYRELKYWTSEGPYQNAANNYQTEYKAGGYTTSFSYHNSNDHTNYERYKLVHLRFKGPRTGNWYDGYYLGFDYEFHQTTDLGNGESKTSDLNADGYYSNWIVKLSPANPDFYTTKTVTLERRVMCEDLGSTFDFDFNDLVFDVKYEQKYKKVNGEWVLESDYAGGLWDATITLQAVGGTLPIYITDFNGTEHDAHQLMGGTLSSNGTYSPVNVGTGSTHAPVTLDIVRRVASTNPENIVIRVKSPDKKDRGASKVTTMILPNPSGLQSFGENLAPQKICMPVDVRWTKEYQQIEWAYPHFAEWVASQNGAAGFGNESDWTRTDVVEKYLYK